MPPQDENAPEAASRAGSRPRSRRRVWWALGLVAALLLAAAGWFGWGLAGSARTIQQAAGQARSDIAAAQQSLEDGDYQAAAEAAASADAAVATAREAADAPQVRLLAALPVVGQPARDLDHLIAAAEELSTGAGELVDAYGQASGQADGATPVFTDGRVDLPRLEDLIGSVESAQSRLITAEDQLRQVEATFPGTVVLAEARDEALAEVVPLQQTLSQALPALQGLPAALGADGPRRYLLFVLNQAELRPTGGAPLSVALLEFDDGALTIPKKGSLADYYDLEKAVWTRVARAPFAPPQGAPDRLTNANTNPNWSISGEELARAARKFDFGDVDGVIAIDLTAAGAVLDATGPLQSDFYGEVTGANLGEKLLVDAYRDFGNDGRFARRELNNQLIEAMVSRLLAGDQVLSVGRALLGTASGKHVQVYLRDPALSATLAGTDLSGDLRYDGGDRIAAYSSNTNASKADVFQQREIDQVVRLRPDGGAEVERTVRVTNQAPADVPNPDDPYQNPSVSASWFFYLPTDAEVIEARGPRGLPTTSYGDGNGGRLLRAAADLDPGETATFTIRYSLPAGTFGTGDALTYVAVAEPQAVWETPTLTLTVEAPDGYLADLDTARPEGWTPKEPGTAVLGLDLDARTEISLTVRRPT